MTVHTRANPSGWSNFTKMTYSQANTLDINQADSVSKTGETLAGGGGISGEVDVITGGSIQTQGTGFITINGNGNLNVGSAGNVNMQLGSNLNFLSGSELNMNSGSIGIITLGPSSVVTFAPFSQLNLQGPVVASGTDCSIDIQGGSIFNIGGASQGLANVQSNGSLFFYSGSLIGGTILVQGGSSMTFQSGCSTTYDASTVLTLDGVLNIATGAIQTGLSFSSSVSGGPLISQVSTTGPGQAMQISAQTSTSSTGGSLYLQSGSGPTPGAVYTQNNFGIYPSKGTQSGQTGVVYREMFFCTTSGTSTQTFTPYIFTLLAGLTFTAEIIYTCKSVPVGGRYYIVGVPGSTALNGAIYGTAATIVQSGGNLEVSITPPAGGDSEWQFDCYLQLN